MPPVREPIGPGQESVWDYPRPPRLERCTKHIVIRFAGIVLADTRGAYRVLETSHPPVYYLPPADIQMQYLSATSNQSFCEWKGQAGYYTVRVGATVAHEAAWFYSHPTPAFAAIAGYVAFYAGRMKACSVDGVPVVPQPGNFYGGWITPDLAGPFKGVPGSWGW
jgi:uncharacterized protein (DUF427 family)